MAYNPGGGQPPFNQQNPYNAPPPPMMPPPPKQGMSTGVKVALFGCLGLLVLAIIAAIVVAVVMVAMNKNSNTSAGYNSNSSSSNTNSRSISNSNTNSGSSSSSSSVHVGSIQLARDKAGDAGDNVDAFHPTDNPMHAVVRLSEFESGTKVRVVLMAVKVASGETEQKVAEIERETSALQNELDTKFTLPRDWPLGTYRIDVYVNGSLDKSMTFQVENP